MAMVMSGEETMIRGPVQRGHFSKSDLTPQLAIFKTLCERVRFLNVLSLQGVRK